MREAHVRKRFARRASLLTYVHDFGGESVRLHKTHTGDMYANDDNESSH